MAAVLQESYITGDDSLGGFQATTWHPQTFTTTSAYTISSVKLLVARLGTPGNLTVSIRATAAGKPTGGDLATVTVDPSSFTTDSAGLWVEFTFTVPYALLNATVYAIIARTATGDNDNRVYWRADISSPSYSGGQSGVSIDSGSSWVMLSSVDKMFETWGSPPLPGKPTTPSPSDSASSITLDETPLGWVDGGNTDTYEIYYRAQGGSWVLVGIAQAGITWAIPFGNIDYGITYEWRIDATNTTGTTTGDTWSFDAISYAQIRISYRLISGGNGNGPYDSTPGVQGTDWEYTGLNFITAVRRLVAAANNKIWYEDI